MKWLSPVQAWRSPRGAIFPIVVAVACWGGIPQRSLAAGVQAYVIFEISASSNETAESLRSASLANCKQLVIGNQERDFFVHIACDEHGNLDQAFLELSRLNGIVHATIVSIKNAAN
jgi:hypothetical protein